MFVIFKVTVAAAGTPGPILGDGVKTTATLLEPTSLPPVPKDSLGSTIDRFNQSTRYKCDVERVTMVGLGSNTGTVYVMPGGQAKTIGRRAAPYEELTPMGDSDSLNDLHLGVLDVDAEVNGEGWLVWAELR